MFNFFPLKINTFIYTNHILYDFIDFIICVFYLRFYCLIICFPILNSSGVNAFNREVFTKWTLFIIGPNKLCGPIHDLITHSKTNCQIKLI